MIASKSKAIRLSQMGSAGLMALLMGVPAIAQTAHAPAAPAQAQAAPETAELDDIIVTAQFRQQNLQDTPLAITAISGDLLAARSQTSVVDVTNQAPSVTLKPQGGNFGPALAANIRGVGQFDFNPALEPGVGVYVDDVYYATLTGSILDLLDLDRVEVLRGPQGTLAGKNSIGGALKLYSKKPTGSNTGYVSAAYGSRNRLDLRASADFKLTDSLFARIAGVAKRQGGYIKRLDFGCVNPQGSAINPTVDGIPAAPPVNSNCKLGTEGDVNYQAVRGQLRFDNDGPIEINVVGDYSSDSRTNPGSVLTFADNSSISVRGNSPAVPFDSRFICGRYCNYATYSQPAGPWTGPVATGYPLVATNFDGRTDYSGWGVSGQIDWKLGDGLKLTSITAYRAYKTIFADDEDLSPLSVQNGTNSLKFWSVSQELRLNGSIADDFIQYTLGGYYLRQKSTYATTQDLRYAVIPLQFFQNDPVRANTKAVFANATINITDALSATGGLRYTKEHKDYHYVRQNYDGSPNPFLGALNGLNGTFDGDRIDYRANVQYRFSDAVMAYAQVSTGFKGGGVNPRPFFAEQVVSFNPETLTSYEIGVKTDLFDRKLRLNLAGFYSKYKDIQLTLLNCPQFGPAAAAPCFLPANAGNADIKGIEVEFNARPVDGLTIDGSLSYIDFKYTFIDPRAGGPTNLFGPQPGDYAPYTPKWKWSLGAQYRVELGDSGSITPRVDASYQSTIFGAATNNALDRIQSYTVINGRLTWKNREADLEISAEVTNIFNKYYFLTAIDLSGGGQGVASAQPGRPREWAISVKKMF
jgi:iron complex outermembrane recepter protein